MSPRAPGALPVWILLGALVLTAASCGGGGGSSSTETTSQGPATSSSSLPGCQTRELRISRGGSGAATGHVEIGLRLQNVSGPRCSVAGFPSVTLLPRSGRLLHVTVEPKSSDFFGQVPKRLVIVPRGGQASFRLAAVDAINGGNCPWASSIRVVLPGDSKPLQLTWRILACPGGMTVSPVAPGRSAYSR